MNAVFPFGFVPATAWYLVLYLSTLLLHIILMNYVIAGSVWLAVAKWRRNDSGGTIRSRNRSFSNVDLLTDWLPFALGGAITAGVAPLLFVQVLYQERFYSANLLLFHRWMSILPVLIVGFYLLYIQKAQWSAAKTATPAVTMTARLGRRLVPWFALACFGFVGYSWTENHLLSNQSPETWSRFFGDKRTFYFELKMVPRLGVWFWGAFPTMLWLLAMQHRFAKSANSNPAIDDYKEPAKVSESPSANPVTNQQTMSVVAIICLGLAVLSGFWYCWLLSQTEKSVIFNLTALPYWCLIIGGLFIQLLGWRRMFCSPAITRGQLGAVGAGILCTMLGTLVLRELLRIATVDPSVWQLHHRRAAEVGGLWVFVCFFVFNLLVVVWCLRSLKSIKH